MGNIKIILLFFFLPRILFSADNNEGILLEAERVKKKGKITLLAGKVKAKTNDFTLTAKELEISDDENEYVAKQGVVIKINGSNDLTIICEKCIYNVKKNRISFVNVEILFNKTTLTTHYCNFLIDTNCLIYEEYGEMKYDGNILSSKKGRISVKDEEIILNKDVICENEHLLLYCQYFNFNRKRGMAIFKEGVAIKFKKAENLTAIVRQVIYDAKKEIFTTDKIVLFNKDTKGYFSSASFDHKKNKIDLYDGFIKNNNNYFKCGNLTYDMKEQDIFLKKKPVAFFQNGIIFTANDLHIKTFYDTNNNSQV